MYCASRWNTKRPVGPRPVFDYRARAQLSGVEGPFAMCIPRGVLARALYAANFGGPVKFATAWLIPSSARVMRPDPSCRVGVRNVKEMAKLRFLRAQGCSCAVPAASSVRRLPSESFSAADFLQPLLLYHPRGVATLRMRFLDAVSTVLCSNWNLLSRKFVLTDIFLASVHA